MPWKEETGTKYDKYWMNSDGTMAINIASAKEEANCDGPIMMPVQGLAFRWIESCLKWEIAEFDLFSILNVTHSELLSEKVQPLSKAWSHLISWQPNCKPFTWTPLKRFG